VHDHIDARRCDFGQCSADNRTRTDGFVLLQYVNQKAQIESLDVAGELLLAESPMLGRLSGTLVLKALRGRNRSTGDGLHNIMPLNATLALEQRAGRLDSAVELVAVTAKDRVSQVRNEVPTPGYALVNLRAGVAWDSVRLELGIENLFDRFYSPPLGGAYLGQGRSMTSAGIPWGVTVPGPGRSAHAALNLSF
jgi:iron complex outermembrane receptor protein